MAGKQKRPWMRRSGRAGSTKPIGLRRDVLALLGPAFPPPESSSVRPMASRGSSSTANGDWLSVQLDEPGARGPP